MSFVKDDHAFTRGVGAVASMDAASPRRRLAAARAARQLARRDAVMALGAMRAGMQPTYAPDPTPDPTPPPSRRGRPSTMMPPRARKVPSRPTMMPGIIKYPGSAIPIAPTAPTAPSTTVIGGGSGTSWTAPSSPGIGVPSPDSPATDASPDLTTTDSASPDLTTPAAPDATTPASTTPAPASSNKLLMYAAIGVAAWWFLLRK